MPLPSVSFADSSSCTYGRARPAHIWFGCRLTFGYRQATGWSALNDLMPPDGEPEKDLLQLVEHAQSGVDVEVDEGGNGFVETHEMRAMPVGATFLAV